MGNATKIPPWTEKVFFAWDYDFRQNIQPALHAIRDADPVRFDALMLDDDGGDVTPLVFERLAWATAVVALLCDTPNVNVGFELGLALGLGKKVFAPCWDWREAPETHAWVRNTSPLSNFLTPGVRGGKDLREKLDQESVWHPGDEQVEELAARLPAPGERYYLCPGGSWDTFYAPFVERDRPFERPKKERYSISELTTTFPDAGQLVWVIAPDAGNSTGIDTWENAGHSVVAGWFLGRHLRADQAKWSASEKALHEALRVATETVFHPIVLGGTTQLPADLRNWCRHVKTVKALDDYLNRLDADRGATSDTHFDGLRGLTPDTTVIPVPPPRGARAGGPERNGPAAPDAPRAAPRVIVPDSETLAELAGDPGAPLAAVVNLVVMALLSDMARHENGPARVQGELGLSDYEFAEVIGNQSLLARVRADLDRLQYVCDGYKLLQDVSPEGVRDFFVAPLPSWQSLLVSRAPRVNVRSPYGAVLARTIRQRALQAELPEKWRRQIEPECRVLLDGTRSRSDKNRALQAVYLRAVLHSAAENTALTLSDFDRELWGKVVRRSQELIPRGEWSHLHYANEAMQKSFARLLRPARRAAGAGVIVRVLEGGVGGANTTHHAIRGVEEALVAQGIPLEKARIEYCGLEINPRFYYAANRILRGDPVPGGPALGVPADDPRVRFFAERRGRFRPLLYDWPFVHLSEMADGIDRLLLDEVEPESFDLFVCSYALHHVPNGVRLAEYLFEPEYGGLPRFATEAPEYRDRFRHELIGLYGPAGRWEAPTPEHLPLTRAFFDAVGGIYPKQQAVLTEEARTIDPDRRDPWAAPGARQMLKDRQLMLIRRVRALLRPGGLVGIADPDGYSGFNREQVPTNAEMAVAHFRSRDEMRLLLEGNGFRVIDDWNLLRLSDDGRGNKVYETSHESMDELERHGKGRLVDHNLGFILVAERL